MNIAGMLLIAALQQFSPGPSSVLVVQNLSFGGILVQPGGGRLTLTPAGSFLPEGNGVLPGASPVSAYARIDLKGIPNGNFHLRVDPASVTLKGPGGSIQIANFQPSRSLDGKFEGTGQMEVMLGGTLDIPAGTPAGFYSTTVNIRLHTDTGRDTIQPMSISCTVRSPLSIKTLSQLDFGTITAGRGGIFRVSPASGYTPIGTDGPRLIKGTPHAASFLITGPAQTPYEIILPTQTMLTGGKNSILVNNIKADQSKGLMPSNGLPVHVGADLQVQANQPPGSYKGVFDVTVAYH